MTQAATKGDGYGKNGGIWHRKEDGRKPRGVIISRKISLCGRNDRRCTSMLTE